VKENLITRSKIFYNKNLVYPRFGWREEGSSSSLGFV
jgi:hypothetical protein